MKHSLRNGMIVVSVVLHAGLAFAFGAVKKHTPREPTVITLREHRVKRPVPVEKPAVTPPKPMAPPKPVAVPKPIAAPKPASTPTPAPPHTAPPAAPTPRRAAPRVMSGGSNAHGPVLPAGNGTDAPAFDVTMSGSSSSGSSEQPVAPSTPPPARAEVTEQLHSHDAPACEEPLVRAHALEVPEPVYPASETTGTEGRVRLELTVDSDGHVVSVRVIQSLGTAFDEAALDAARNARFEPATRCGKAERSTFTMSLRFSP